MSRRAIAHRRADQGRVILASIRDRAPATGLLAGLFQRIERPDGKQAETVAARLAAQGFELRQTERGWEISGNGRRVCCTFWAHVIDVAKMLETVAK